MRTHGKRFTTAVATLEQRFYPAREAVEQVKKIAEMKMPDLNATSLDAAMKMVAGTARSMGLEVVD